LCLSVRRESERRRYQGAYLHGESGETAIELDHVHAFHERQLIDGRI
jgi:hypothetical protein